jgi:hypothetical protein
MEVYKPLRAVLFFWDCLRFLTLAAIFMFFSPLEGAQMDGVFPYLAYVAPNALYLLMTLFLLVALDEFKKYLPLYIAGKAAALAAFYAWAVFSFSPAQVRAYFALGPDNFARVLALLGGSFVLSLGDVLSIFAGWILLNKIKQPGTRVITETLFAETGFPKTAVQAEECDADNSDSER